MKYCIVLMFLLLFVCYAQAEDAYKYSNPNPNYSPVGFTPLSDSEKDLEQEVEDLKQEVKDLRDAYEALNKQIKYHVMPLLIHNEGKLFKIEMDLKALRRGY